MWTIGAGYCRRPRDLSDRVGAWCISERIPVSSDRSPGTPDLSPRACTRAIAGRHERTLALDLAMDYHTGDPVLDERSGRLRARRREQERAAAEIASDTSELLRRFAAQLSVGDAAVLLGVSKGRISQLRGGSAGQSTSAARRTGTDG